MQASRCAAGLAGGSPDRGPPLASLPGRPGVAGIALQHGVMLGQAVALEPADRRFQLRRGHLGAGLVASNALQNGVGTVIQPRSGRHPPRALVLDRLLRNQLADALTQMPLQDRGRQLRLRRPGRMLPERVIGARLEDALA